MSSHIYHEPIEKAGLHVGCERCAEIAERPTVHLDAGHLNAYWQKMLATKVRGDHVGAYTDLDYDACEYLYRVFVDLERLADAAVL